MPLIVNRKPIHKKPIDMTPSVLVKKFLPVLEGINGLVLDVGSGFGRNAFPLVSLSRRVVCIDNYTVALKEIEQIKHDKYPNALLETLRMDLEKDAWPFQEKSVDLIINVHYFNSKVFPLLLSSLKEGGYLLFETIDARGKNYYELPPQGTIDNHFADHYETIYYNENKINKYSVSTIKLFARKR